MVLVSALALRWAFLHLWCFGQEEKEKAYDCPNLKEPHISGHTRDNAFLSRKAVDRDGVEIKTALIVCKAFHARRCLMLYQIAFPDVDIKVCPVHCYNITKDNWYKSEAGIDRVLGELARCGNQFVGDIKQYIL